MAGASDGGFVRAWVYPAAMRTYLTLITGRGFDVDGELLEVARQLQVEGASPRLISFTAHISGKVTSVLVNPEHVVFLAAATGSDLRSGECRELDAHSARQRPALSQEAPSLSRPSPRCAPEGPLGAQA